MPNIWIKAVVKHFTNNTMLHPDCILTYLQAMSGILLRLCWQKCVNVYEHLQCRNFYIEDKISWFLSNAATSYSTFET